MPKELAGQRKWLVMPKGMGAGGEGGGGSPNNPPPPSPPAPMTKGMVVYHRFWGNGLSPVLKETPWEAGSENSTPTHTESRLPSFYSIIVVQQPVQRGRANLVLSEARRKIQSEEPYQDASCVVTPWFPDPPPNKSYSSCWCGGTGAFLRRPKQLRDTFRGRFSWKMRQAASPSLP